MATTAPFHGAGDGCLFGLAAAARPSPPTLHVALAGAGRAAVLEGFRSFPGTHVLLVHTVAEAPAARRLGVAFEAAGVPTDLREAGDEACLGTMRALNDAVHESRLGYERVVLNATGGTREAACAALAIAFLHGLPAFVVDAGAARALPVLPVPLRARLSDADVRVLVGLCASSRSPRDLARRARVSAPRLRALVGGEPGRAGLVALGLVEEVAGGARLRLTRTGATLLACGSLTSGSPTV